MTAELSSALGLEGEPGAAAQLGGHGGGPSGSARDRSGAPAGERPRQLHADPAAPVTEEYLDELRQRLLAAGIRADEVGDLHTLGDWSRARIETAWARFVRLNRHEIRLRRGGLDRLTRAWNVHLDDLGVNDPWPTVLHFVANLDAIAMASMGVPYDAEGTRSAIDSFRPVRLAGASVAVHARAVYFTAAAQLGMDVRAGLEAGAGHYIPAGGFRILLRDIREQAELLARTRARPIPHRGAAPTPPRAIAGGARIYATILEELHRASLVLREQADPDGPDLIAGHSPDEHREPLMRAFFQRHAAAIEALPQVASDAEVPVAAAALLQILEDAPRLAHHGAGSVDPHGTDHAMGLAIDLYNGAGQNRDARGPGGSQHNFGVHQQDWPFLHELIGRYGADYGIPPRLRPDDLHDLHPEQGRALSRMMREHGRQLLEELRAEVPPIDTPESESARREAAHSYQRLRFEIRNALWACVGALNDTRKPRYRAILSAESRDRVESAIAALRRDNGALLSLPPEQVLTALGEHLRTLDEVQAALLADHAARLHTVEAEVAQHAAPTAAPEGQPAAQRRRAERQHEREAARDQRLLVRARDPGALDDLISGSGASSIPALRARLSESLTAATEAFTYRRHQELRALARSSLFQRWVENASNPDRPLYDQPQIMVEAIDDVRAHAENGRVDYDTHFYDGHHWTIAPRAILASTPATYRASLVRDMEVRLAAGQLERVLMIMAESDGGRSILSSSENDPTFHAALHQVAGDGEALAMIQRVSERVISPFDAPAAAAEEGAAPPIANAATPAARAAARATARDARTAAADARTAARDSRDHGYY